MTDDEIRAAVSEQVVQSSETIENLRIEVVDLKAELDKAWRAAVDQSSENTRLRLAMIGASDAIRAAAKEQGNA